MSTGKHSSREEVDPEHEGATTQSHGTDRANPDTQGTLDAAVDQKSDKSAAGLPVASGVIGKPFEKGRSGNPAGRPKGARNKATLLSEAVLEDNAEALAKKLVEVALSGDVSALALCMKFLLPVMRKRAVELDLPTLETIEDGLKIMTIIMKAVSNAEITLEDAQQLTALVDLHRRILETVDMEARIQRLEVAHEKRRAWEREDD